ncbi:hypothetical protein AXF42_Ash021789 [Apostasia shenzhenica]|uniref:Uncharacterized protein n=1 Tax=Apostasia shenzhenica TaxID=1088818 RepID=A0A2H9ZZC9_9ASPA|nr:hypothetical protein AXF42_Ash021789 [Apostasia shenzhenica]
MQWVLPSVIRRRVMRSASSPASSGSMSHGKDLMPGKEWRGGGRVLPLQARPKAHAQEEQTAGRRVRSDAGNNSPMETRSTGGSSAKSASEVTDASDAMP